jgi:hypothetical protein
MIRKNITATQLALCIARKLDHVSCISRYWFLLSAQWILPQVVTTIFLTLVVVLHSINSKLKFHHNNNVYFYKKVSKQEGI